MTRDPDLLRNIVFDVEACDQGEVWSSKPSDRHNEREVVAHVKLLEDRGLVEARYAGDDHCAVLRLTDAGHDFADAVRDDSIWKKVKVDTLAALKASAPSILASLLTSRFTG